MSSHVLDRVESSEETRVGSPAGARVLAQAGSPAPVSCVEVSCVEVSCVEVWGDAIARLLQTPPPAVLCAGTVALSAADAQATTAPARRHIPPASGHALEKLGHAIEYLTDEYVHAGCEGGLTSPRIAAIQILMALNRGVYYECPIVPPLSQRIRKLVGRAIGH